LVQIVAGHTPRDGRVTRPDQCRISVAECSQLAVDFATPAANTDHPLQLLLASGPHPQPQTVVSQYLQFLDVVDGLSPHQRVNTAGIVADHAAESAVRVSRRIRGEGQMIPLRPVAQMVEHYSRLHARPFGRGINRHDLAHVPRHVEDHRDVAALAGQACATSARQNRSAKPAANLDSSNHVLGVPRKDHTNGYLAIIRGVSGIEGTSAFVESDFPADPGPQV